MIWTAKKKQEKGTKRAPKGGRRARAREETREETRDKNHGVEQADAGVRGAEGGPGTGVAGRAAGG